MKLRNKCRAGNVSRMSRSYEAGQPVDGEAVKVGHGTNVVDGQFAIIATRVFVLIGVTVYDLCKRCGTELGTISSYLHVLGGMCAGCNGNGVGRRLGTRADAERIAARRNKAKATRDARRAADTAAALAAQQEWRAANADLYAALLREHHLHTTHDGADARRDQKLTWRPAELVTLAARACSDYAAPLTADDATRAAELLAEVAAADTAAHAEREAKVAGSRWAGEIGQRITVTGTIAVAKPFESRFGSGVFVVVDGTGDDAGVTLTLMSGAAGVWALTRGDTATVTATVDELTAREDVKQTKVTRGRITAHVKAPTVGEEN
jgi:hypothetical protein